MTEFMRDSLTDLLTELDNLQGDVVWIRALLKQSKGKVRLHNLRRANYALQTHAESLQIQAQALVDECEQKRA